MNTRKKAKQQEPATVAELRSALPGIDAEFLLALIEAGATVEEAIPQWIGELNRRYEKLQQELTEVRAGKR